MATVKVFFDVPFNGGLSSGGANSHTVTDVENITNEDGFLWLFDNNDVVLACFNKWNYVVTE